MERGGVNFAVFSEHATGVTLVLFAKGAIEPMVEFPFDPVINRTGNVWHAFVGGIDPGLDYGYRMNRDKKLQRGTDRFDPDLVLLDPYARGCRRVAPPRGDLGTRMLRRSTIVDTSFDWGFDRPLDLPLADTVLYEINVTACAGKSSGDKSKGTFGALTRKIPYLRSLGVTAVELMPVTEFDESDNPRVNPITGQKLGNFWGYHPLSFFALHAPYGSRPSPGEVLRELKTMVKTFHEAGIEVILDVVFNHSGEGDAGQATSSFRGLDNSVYYMVNPADGRYLDFSGCGNTFNCNHPVVRDLVLDCLRYWVTEVHVDGFRFDLASILGRAEDGRVLANPPLIERIVGDPVLAKSKLIAEAWDAAGLYQVGSFPEGQRWAEWNGCFRDDVRRFVRGDPGMVPALAARLAGSPDLYQASGREPWHSINFVTCHDGFTLADLVSYNGKHNLLNGENNADGANENFSWNCGEEGPSNDPGIEQLRRQQVKNLATLLFVAHGVPMILYGDELGRTQDGNNNAYCHRDGAGEFHWPLEDENQPLLRFFRNLIAFRQRTSCLRRASFHPRPGEARLNMVWHGVQAGNPDWSYDSRSLALHIFQGQGDGPATSHVYLIANAYWEPLQFALPVIDGWRWKRFLDTAASPPDDIAELGQEFELDSQSFYRVAARSTVVLLGHPESAPGEL